MVSKNFNDIEDLKKSLKMLASQPKQEPLLPLSGNYRALYSYQKAEAIDDITYYLCKNYLQRGDRTIDQTVQAARSGKQHIVKGCTASSTSRGTEIKLINVAKASFQELLIDYEDCLKTRNHRQWQHNSIELQKMRQPGSRHNESAYYMPIIKTRPQETISNMAICLIKQTDYLPFKQLENLSKDLLKNGDFRERMTRMRIEKKK